MQNVANALRDRVSKAAPQLRAVSDASAAVKPAPERWSKKEILGHLIDSACNNHQRFVRAQLQGSLTFPGYEQEGWARCQGYANSDWRLLIGLWEAYNRHLADVIERLPADAQANVCHIGAYEPATLAWLVEDYVVHMDHHLAQLL